MLNQPDSMELDETRTAKPLARPWGSASTSSAERRQAREPTPDADDERYACSWNHHGPDPQKNTVPDNPRTNAQTYHSHKMDSPLMRSWADQSTSRPPHNSAGAPCPNAEAETNITRSVSTFEPEGALRVPPQRTLIRQKFRPAQCQQTAHCTPPVRSTTLRPQQPMHRRLSHVPPALDSLCCTAHPPALTASDAPKVARTQNTQDIMHIGGTKRPYRFLGPITTATEHVRLSPTWASFPSPPVSFSCATRPLKRTGLPAPPAHGNRHVQTAHTI